MAERGVASGKMPARRINARTAVLALVGAKLGAHAVTLLITPYEFHRDEFLYAAMGDHLSLWRMDFPPFIALLANLQRALFGHEVWSIRVLPALAGALLVWLTMDAARRLGGGVLAQVTAGATVLLSPLFLRTAALFQPVVFDQLWWSMALWCLLRRGLDDDPRWWMGVGGALGLGLLTKFSIAFIAVPLALATLVTGLRRDLRTPWPWAALAISLLLGLPSLTGQVALGWPFFGQMADLQASQLSRVGWGSFLGEQILMVGPGAFLAVVGSFLLVFRWRRAALQAAGLSILGGLVFLLLLHGKAYYAGPLYPVALAAGAALLLPARGSGGETGTDQETAASRSGVLERERPSPGRLKIAAWGLGGLLILQVVFGLVTLPMGLPILPKEPMARYSEMLGITAATRTNVGVQLELPQDYADMLGWEPFADSVAAVWSRLDESERSSAVLLGTNYGRAGSLDWYGGERGLPPSVAPVGSYWFWGPGDREWNVVVVAGSDSTSLATYFGEVSEAARVRDPWRVPEERDVGIFIARHPFESIEEVWPRFAGVN